MQKVRKKNAKFAKVQNKQKKTCIIENNFFKFLK